MRKCTLSAAVLGMVFAGQAMATPIHYTVSGLVARATNDIREFQVGDRMTVDLTLDVDGTETPDKVVIAGKNVIYANLFTDITFTSSGGYNSSYSNPAGFGQIQIINTTGAGYDSIRVTIADTHAYSQLNSLTNTVELDGANCDGCIGALNSAYGPQPLKYLQFYLKSNDASLLDSLAVPTALDPAGFDAGGSFLTLQIPTSLGTGSPGLDLISVTAVPAPTAVWLFGSALTALVCIGRRRNYS